MSRGDVRTRWALSLVRTPEGREGTRWTVQNKETAHQRVSHKQVHQYVALVSCIVLWIRASMRRRHGRRRRRDSFQKMLSRARPRLNQPARITPITTPSQAPSDKMICASSSQSCRHRTALTLVHECIGHYFSSHALSMRLSDLQAQTGQRVRCYTQPYVTKLCMSSQSLSHMTPRAFII